MKVDIVRLIGWVAMLVLLALLWWYIISTGLHIVRLESGP